LYRFGEPDAGDFTNGVGADVDVLVATNGRIVVVVTHGGAARWRTENIA